MKVRIIESVKEDFEKKIRAFSRKCEKLDIPFNCEQTDAEKWFYYHYTPLNSYDVFTKTIPATDTEKVEQARRSGHFLQPFKVLVYEMSEAEALVKGEYQVIGKIEVMEAGNLITAFSDVEIDGKFRHTEAICEHCGSKRERKYLFVILNTETGEQFQVGSSCLRYYAFGRTSDQIRAYYEWLSDMSSCNIVSGRDYSGSIGFGKPYYDIVDVLLYAIGMTEKIGYYSSKTDYPTKCAVLEVLNGHRVGMSNAEITDKINEGCKRYAITKNDIIAMEEIPVERAKEIINYFVSECERKDAAELSDFMWNVYTLLKEGYIQAEKIGYIVCLPNLYAKAMNRATERKIQEEAAKSKEYFGEIKKRYTIDAAEILSVDALAQWETDYGYGSIITIYKIETAEYTFIWKTANYIDPDELKKAEKFVFTVKEHSEYNGAKQTVITRCVLK